MSFTGKEPSFVTQVFNDNSLKVSTTEYVEKAVTPNAINITSLNIDWANGFTFYKSIVANSTFTFSNLTEGKAVSVIVINTTGAAVTVTFPTIKKSTTFNSTVAQNSSNIYTFIRAGSVTYASFISGLV